MTSPICSGQSHWQLLVNEMNAPPVNRCVALVEPPDGGQFVSGSHGTQVDEQVVLGHHQVQRSHDVPAGGADMSAATSYFCLTAVVSSAR